MLTDIIDENNTSIQNIYNADETELTVVRKLYKVKAKKGKHQVGSATSLERGQTTTAIRCMNASESCVPPAFIFPSVRMKEEF